MNNILFRSDNDTKEELNIAKQYFNTYDCRTEVPNESLVIGRYSVLPFYKELEKDLINRNCKLINSFSEHNWIASFDWYFSNEEIQKYTPKSWLEYDLRYIKNEYEGPYVVKGQTNSRKHNWNTHMYAETFKDLINVISNLKNDGLICDQTLIIRKYEKLKTLEVGINGLPFTNEWRFFCYKNHILSKGYYWTGLDDKNKPSIDANAINLVNNLMPIVSKYTNFYVLDIAQKENGEWILIEINDGQMSGLSENDPKELYFNLKQLL